MAHAAYIYICIFNHTNIYVYIFRYACTYEGILHISRRPSAHWRTSMREALMNCSGEENLAGRLLSENNLLVNENCVGLVCFLCVSLSLSISLSPSLSIYINIYREREREGEGGTNRGREREV